MRYSSKMNVADVVYGLVLENVEMHLMEII